jgi:hypothetical protein
MHAKSITDPKLDFSAWSGRGVKIAVIDSGIDPRHPKISRVKGGVEFAVNNKGKVIRGIGMALMDRAGHGTACAGIIHKIAPSAELYSVRVFDESLSTDDRALLAALRWAIEYGMDVVNLSLGTIDPAIKGEMQALCREALRQKIILVAAAHNEGVDSFPAVLPEVIGVCGGEVRGPYGYYFRPGDKIECTARGDLQRVCWVGRREIDADEYIQDTLDALRSVGKTRVLALAMSDKEKHPCQVMGRVVARQMEEGEIAAKLEYLERRFALPAVSILSERGQERLMELVVDCFGDKRKEGMWTKKSA